MLARSVCGGSAGGAARRSEKGGMDGQRGFSSEGASAAPSAERVASSVSSREDATRDPRAWPLSNYILIEIELVW